MEVRIYDNLFSVERPMDVAPGGSFLDNLNPNSLETIPLAYGEPSLANAAEGARYQFERLGYFVKDSNTAADGKPVFNKTVGLRDTWAKALAKIAKK
jgi:glutaminyl-tRNA synthetase